MKLLYQDLIPEDHKCSRCDKNKEEVGFSVAVYKSERKPYIFKLCNGCLSDSKKPTKQRRVVIKQKIDRYFKEVA